MKKSNRLISKKVLAAVMAGLTLAATLPATPVADWFHASYKVKAEGEESSYEYKVVSKDRVVYVYKNRIYDADGYLENTIYSIKTMWRNGNVTEEESEDNLGLWNGDYGIAYETSDGIVYTYEYDGEVGEENIDANWSVNVIGYNGEYTEILTIPAEIDGENVKGIQAQYSTVVFDEEEKKYEEEYNYSRLGSNTNYHILILEDGIETIDDQALQGEGSQNGNRWFQLPESIKSIGDSVFDYQNSFGLTVSENLQTNDVDYQGNPVTIGTIYGGCPNSIVVTKAQNSEGIGLYPNAYGSFLSSSFYIIQDGVTISDEFKESSCHSGYLVFDYSDNGEHKLKVKSIQKNEWDYVSYSGMDPIYINGQEYTFEKELTFVEEKPATCADYGKKAHYEDQFGNKYLDNNESTLIDEYSSELLIDPTGLHTDDGTGKCSVCGKILDEIGAKLAGYSISLDGSIGVNFYMELNGGFISRVRYGSELYQNAYMKFTLPDGSTEQVKVIDALNDESSVYTKQHEDEYGGTYTDYYYMFQCHVPAKEMTGTIKAQIIVDEENGIVGNEYTYSVKDYADYLLAHVDDNDAFKKAADVVKSMLVYGAYAQKYFDHFTDNYAYDLEAADSEISSVSSDDLKDYSQSELEVTETDNVKFIGTNLSLLSETTLRLFFSVNGNIEDVEFECNGEELEAKKYKEYFYVELDNIAAKNLGDKFVVEITDTAGQTGKVTYSPMAYAYLVLSRPTDEIRTDNLKMLMKALYNYNRKAVEYFQ